MIAINKDVSTPFYVQIKEMLKDDIVKGKYLPKRTDSIRNRISKVAKRKQNDGQ